MCYKDMTFCKFYENCKDKETCERVLTNKDKSIILTYEIPVCYFMERPECFKESKKGEIQ